MVRLLIAAIGFAAALAPACAQDRALPTQTAQLTVRTVTHGLEHPWSLAFLPDGRMLVTERPGRLRVVTADGQISPPLTGLPRIVSQQQGGLLDVILDPNFASNQFVYFSFSEPGDGGTS